MTLIIGARCKDGVVLIADRKIDEQGQIFAADKIQFGPVNALFSGAGIMELLDKFVSRVAAISSQRKTEHFRRIIAGNPSSAPSPDSVSSYEYVDEFVGDCESILAKLRDDYRNVIVSTNQGLDVLLAFRTGDVAELHYMEIQNPIDSKRKSYACIGSGAPYAQIFLKELWNEEMTMHEMARLGQFIIHYIESQKLDNYVGLGSDVYVVPDLPDDFSAYYKEVQEKNPGSISTDPRILAHLPGKLVRPKDLPLDDEVAEFRAAFTKLAQKLGIRLPTRAD